MNRHYLMNPIDLYAIWVYTILPWLIYTVNFQLCLLKGSELSISCKGEIYLQNQKLLSNKAVKALIVNRILSIAIFAWMVAWNNAYNPFKNWPMTSSTAGTQEYTEVVGGPFRTFKPTVSTRTVTWTVDKQSNNQSINQSIIQSMN